MTAAVQNLRTELITWCSIYLFGAPSPKVGVKSPFAGSRYSIRPSQK